MPPVTPSRVKVGPRWYRLAEDKDGTPIYRQIPAPFYPAQVSQADMSEAQVSPEGRLPFSFRDLSGGAGQAETPVQGPNTRYDHIGDAEGEGVDATLTPEGPVILAASLNTQTPPTNTASDNLLGVLWKGGAATAYFAMGRYVYSWTGSAFAFVGDLATPATDGILAFRGVGAADTWYAPQGYALPMKFSADSGVNWTAITTTGGISNVQSAVVIDGTVTVAQVSPVGGSARITSFDNGGATPTGFGVIDPVGDPAFPISRMISFAGRVVILKDGEGVFLLTADRLTLQQEVFPELRGVKLYTAGATVWRGMLWLPTDRGLYAISSGFTLQAVGPEQAPSSSVVSGRGVVTAVAGDAYNLYGFRYAGSANASWIYKANVTTSGGGVSEIAWHPYLQGATGGQCQHMEVLSPGGLGPKLLLDRETSAGVFTLNWFVLPSQGRDPRADSAFRYAAGGTLYYSRLTARFPAILKSFYGVTPLTAPLGTKVDGSTATTAQSVRPRYKLDSTALAASSPFGYTQSSLQSNGAGTRVQFAVHGRGLDTGIRLASSDSTTTPQLHAVTVEYDPRPSAIFRHEMRLNVGAGAVDASGRAGWADPQTPGKALEALRALPGAAGNIDFTDPWGNDYSVSVPINGFLPRPAGPRDVGHNGELPLLIDLVVVEQAARASGTWAIVGQYTWAQVASFTWGALPALAG